MNLLAVDTAGKTAAVAVLRDDTLLYEAQCNNGLTHSETLLPMIDTALKASGLTVFAGPTEGTALGNLMVQFIHSGDFADLAEARAAIRRSFEIKEYQPE